jgi:VCBS repeat-containing protein
MPSEIKTTLNASTNHATTSTSNKRSQAVSSTTTVTVWTISGIVLASCASDANNFLHSFTGPFEGGGGLSLSVADGVLVGALVLTEDQYTQFRANADTDSSNTIDKAEIDAWALANGGVLTGADGQISGFQGTPYIAIATGAIDTSNPTVVLTTGEYRFLPGGGLASPISDLIIDWLAANPGMEVDDALKALFGTENPADPDSPPLITQADLEVIGNYEIQAMPQTTMPAENDPDYAAKLASYKAWLVSRAAIGTASQTDGGATDAAARLAAVKHVLDNPADTMSTPVAVAVTAREMEGRTILAGKPIAIPERIVTVNEDDTYTLRESVLGFVDRNGNPMDANTDGVITPSSFKGILVHPMVAFSGTGAVMVMFEDGAGNVTVLGGNQVHPDDTLPAIPTGITGYHYVSAGYLSGLSITPPANQSGTLSLDYFVYDGEQWSGTTTAEKAVLNIIVTPVDDAPTAIDSSVAPVRASAATHTFAAGEFNSSDPDAGHADWAKIRIASLPAKGALEYDGNPATVGLEIDRADIGKLIYKPVTTTTAAEDITFTFAVIDAGGLQSAPAMMTIPLTVSDGPVHRFTGTYSGTTATAMLTEDFASGSATTADISFSDADDANSVIKVQVYIDDGSGNSPDFSTSTGTEVSQTTSAAASAGATYGSVGLSARDDTAGTMTFEYTRNSTSLQSLVTGQSRTERVTIYLYDDNNVASSPLTFNVVIAGENDAAVATNTVTGDNDVTEDDTGNDTASGTIGVTDVDTGQDATNMIVRYTAGASAVRPTTASPSVAVGATSPTITGTYGDFTLARAADGTLSWSYQLVHTRAATNALSPTQQVTDKLIVVIWDTADGNAAVSAPLEIEIDVTGANDRPTVTYTSDGSRAKTATIGEDSAGSTSAISFDIADIDAGNTLIVDATVTTGAGINAQPSDPVYDSRFPDIDVPGGTLDGMYGVFTLTRNAQGALTVSYNPNESDDAIEALNAGQSFFEKLSIFVNDRSMTGNAVSEVLTYTAEIQGSNDPVNRPAQGALTVSSFSSVKEIGDTVTIIDGVTDLDGTTMATRMYGVYYSGTDFADEAAFDRGGKTEITSLTSGTSSGKPTRAFDLTVAMLEKVFYARVSFEDDIGWDESEYLKIGRHDIANNKDDAIPLTTFHGNQEGVVNGYFNSNGDSDWYSFTLTGTHLVSISVASSFTSRDILGVKFRGSDGGAIGGDSFITIDNNDDRINLEEATRRLNAGDYFIEIGGQTRIGDYSFEVDIQ